MQTSSAQSNSAPGLAPKRSNTPRRNRSRSRAGQGKGKNEQRVMRSADTLTYELVFEDGYKTTLGGHGPWFPYMEPIHGNLDYLPTSRQLYDLAKQMDQSKFSAPKLHPTPAVDYVGFLKSQEMSLVLASHANQKQFVIVDYGCGHDGRLGVLLMNHLHLTNSILVGIDNHEPSLQALDAQFPGMAHYSNLFLNYEGDYLKSTLSGADISVGNLHWELNNPKSFFQGISNMLGSARTIILFAPDKLRSAVRVLVDLHYHGMNPVIIEKRATFMTGRRPQQTNHTYDGHFISIVGGERLSPQLNVSWALERALKSLEPPKGDDKIVPRKVLSKYFSLLEKHYDALGPLYDMLVKVVEPESCVDDYSASTTHRDGVDVQALIFSRPNHDYAQLSDIQPLDADECFWVLQQHLLAQSKRANTNRSHILRAVKLYKEQYKSFHHAFSFTESYLQYDELTDAGLKKVAPLRKNPPKRAQPAIFSEAVLDDNFVPEYGRLPPVEMLADLEIIKPALKAPAQGANLSSSNNWEPRAEPIGYHAFALKQISKQGLPQGLIVPSRPWNQIPSHSPADALMESQHFADPTALQGVQFSPIVDYSAVEHRNAAVNTSRDQADIYKNDLINRLEVELKTAREQSTQDQARLSRANQTVSRLEAEVLSLQQEGESVRQALSQLQGDAKLQQKSKAQIQSLQTQLSVSQLDVQQRQRLVEQLQASLDKTNQELTAAQYQHQVAKTMHDSSLKSQSSLDADLATSQRERNSLSLRLQSLTMESQADKQLIESQQAKIGKLTNDLATLKSEALITFDTQHAEAESVILDLQQQIKQLDQEVRQLTQRCSSLNDAKATADALLQDLSARHQDALNTAEQKAREVRQSQLQASDLATKLQGTTAQLESAGQRQVRSEQLYNDAAKAAQSNFDQLKLTEAELAAQIARYQELEHQAKEALQLANVQKESMNTKRGQDLLASVLQILSSYPNSFDVVKPLLAVWTDELTEETLSQVDEATLTQLRRIAEIITGYQPWLEELASLQFAGLADPVSHLVPIVGWTNSECNMVRRLLMVFLKYQEHLKSCVDRNKVLLNLTKAFRSKVIPAARQSPPELTVEQAQWLDLIELEMVNVYQFSLGRSILYRDQNLFYDGLFVAKHFHYVVCTIDDGAAQLMHERYMLILSAVLAVLPAPLSEEFAVQLQVFPTLHQLLQILMSRNPFLQAVHNVLFVLALVAQAVKDWGMICFSFDHNNQQVMNQHFCLPYTHYDYALNDQEATSQRSYHRLNKLPTADRAGEVNRILQLHGLSDLSTRMISILGLYIVPISLQQWSAQTELLCTIYTIELMSILIGALRQPQAGRNYQSEVNALLAMIASHRYDDIVFAQDMLATFAQFLSLPGVSTLAQAAYTIQNPSQASTYSRRVPGLIPLGMLQSMQHHQQFSILGEKFHSQRELLFTLLEAQQRNEEHEQPRIRQDAVRSPKRLPPIEESKVALPEEESQYYDVQTEFEQVRATTMTDADAPGFGKKTKQLIPRNPQSKVRHQPREESEEEMPTESEYSETWDDRAHHE